MRISIHTHCNTIFHTHTLSHIHTPKHTYIVPHAYHTYHPSLPVVVPLTLLVQPIHESIVTLPASVEVVADNVR
jgi:hypothetical protein